MDRADTEEQILVHYREITRAIDRAVLPRLIELGLTMSQFKALIAVVSAGSEGISVTQLGHELSIGQPSASLIVGQIVRLGYVERVSDVTDRRRILVTATPAGVELTGELRHGRRSMFRDWLRRIDDDDAEALAQGLGALDAAVEAAHAESARAR